MVKESLNSTSVLGVKINTVTHTQAIEIFERLYAQKKQSIICTVNSEFIMKAKQVPEFLEILNKKSSLNLADGFGLLWSAKFKTLKKPGQNFSNFMKWIGLILMIPFRPKYFNDPIPERVTGVDFVQTLAQYCAKNKIKIFFLGGGPTVAERAALELQTRIPDLRISGVYSGGDRQKGSIEEDETAKMIEAINASKAGLLLVAFGCPKQEIWLNKNLNKTCAKIGIGVGGTFDFIAGAKKRAPYWMRKSGLEWLFRLIVEPKRLKRQLTIPQLMWQTLVTDEK